MRGLYRWTDTVIAKKMKIIVTGATGMAGAEGIRQANADNDIPEIIALGGRPLALPHPKITTGNHDVLFN